MLIGVGANQVLISAIQDTEKKGKPTLPGTAYLFELDGNWVQTFTNPNPSVDDAFGVSVALDPNTLVIGSLGDDADAEKFINNPEPALGDFFGAHVAAVGTDKVLIGAPGDDTMAPKKSQKIDGLST